MESEPTRRSRLDRILVVLSFALAMSTLGGGCGDIEDPTLRVDDPTRFEAPDPPLRVVAPDELRNVFFGDLHIHTSHSYDAYTMGVRATPDDAYAYAKGETIRHAAGYPVRASRPLDFAAVTDHAEYLGAARAAAAAAGEDEAGSFPDAVASGSALRFTAQFVYAITTKMATQEAREETFGDIDPAVSAQAWREIIASAEAHNDPGRFTAFIGYEWTSMPNSANLHRNVIYRSNNVPARPFSSLDSENPEDLWRALEQGRASGRAVIAIPHNGNVSNGRMYERTLFDGSAMTDEYARVRMWNEPISEILQVKGQSETHPVLSSEDEFARYELFDQILGASAAASEPRGSYSRDAYRTGLELEDSTRFNPYRFGVIGSSDSHNATSSVEEDNYHGKLPFMDGTAGIRLGEMLWLPRSQQRGASWGAQGLAGVWAEENTRASLFDALRRKETYATSGPRIEVRFFGGWDFDATLTEATDFVARAYARGVPMGGTLGRAPGPGRAPTLAVMALKDPIGAQLDRIQIVKGWVDEAGQSHERIYDVAASDGRTASATGRVPSLPSTVDVATASYTNAVGAAQLAAVWRDPDFEPASSAFYYARVLEIETPRWSTYDAMRLGVEAPEPQTIHERAITSPVWYRPNGPKRPL